MSDSIVSSVGFNRSNLNQDISRVVTEQGKLNYAQVLGLCYPARAITPRLYKKTHLRPRCVKCVFIGPNDPVPTECPDKYALLAVMGVGFTRRETEDVSALLQNSKAGRRVLFGIPKEPMPGIAQLKEFQAIHTLSSQEPYNQPGTAQNILNNRRDMLRRQLVEKLRPELRPGKFDWSYLGSDLGIDLDDEPELAGSRNNFFTAVLEKIYRRDRRSAPHGSVRDRYEAVDVLLNVQEPLQFLSFDKSGKTEIIREFLVGNGVVEITKDCGNYVVEQVCGVSDSHKGALSSVWNELLVMLLGNGQEEHRCNLSDILRKFTAYPYGMEVSYLNILIAAAIRRYYPAVSIVCDGQEVELNSQALRRVWGKAAHSQIVYLPQAPYESADCLRKIVELCGFPYDGRYLRDLWEIAKDALVEWYDRLSPLARTLKVGEDEPAYVLKELLESRREASARKFIGDGLILAAGFSGLPHGEELERFEAWLQEALTAFSQYEEYCKYKMAERIAMQFGYEEAELPTSSEDYIPILNSLFRRWFSRLYPQSGSQKLGPWSEALAEMYALQPNADSKYWFELLPLQFELPPLSQWKDDHSVTFTARLVRACLELQLWHIEKLFPLPEDKQEAERKLSHWVRSLLNGVGLEQKERESVFLDLMERFCWSV